MFTETDVQISRLWLLLCMPLMKLAMLCEKMDNAVHYEIHQ